MYAQIFLGIAMIVVAIINKANLDIILNKKMKREISKNELKAYQKSLALPFFLLGIFFISMGIVEEMEILESTLFVTLYLVVTIVLLGIIAKNNKKHLGKYRLT